MREKNDQKNPNSVYLHPPLFMDGTTFKARHKTNKVSCEVDPNSVSKESRVLPLQKEGASCLCSSRSHL